MKKTLIIVLMLISTVIGHAITKQDSLKRAQILEAQFSEIRADIARSACKAFGYDNVDVLKRINAKELRSFYDALSKDTKANKALIGCLGSVPSIPIDGDLKKCRDGVMIYLNQVKQGCKNKDVKWADDIEHKISELEKECICYDQGDTEAYRQNYPEGCFSALIDLTNQSFVDATLKKSTSPGEDNKPSDDNNPRIVGPSLNSLKKYLWLIALAIVLALISFTVLWIKRRKKKEATKCIIGNSVPDTPLTTSTIPPTVPSSGVLESQSTTASNVPQGGEPNDVPSGLVVPEVGESKENTSDNEWIVVGASVKGNGHIQSNMPCQDNNKFESLGDGWGVAIVSDGAGSALHSEIGSRIIVERGCVHFKELIKKEGWKTNALLPTDAEWLQKSYYTLKRLRDEVELVANKNEVDFKSLSATCLVVIYSPIGLLAVHVGDGRMGYKTQSGEWKSMMTPHKGAEANQTIFLISDFWSYPNYVMSGVLVPESVVIREPVQAFALMSDGCENTSWQCTILDQETGKFYDRNRPYTGFFNPLEETILSFKANGVPEEERQSKWHKFVESGTSGFVREQDDKTMIYGVNLNLCK